MPVDQTTQRNRRLRLYATFLVLAMVGAHALYNSFKLSERNIALVVEQRGDSMREMLLRAEAAALAMRDSFLFNLDLAFQGNLHHPRRGRLRDSGIGAEGAPDIYVIDRTATSGDAGESLETLGTLTGAGKVEDLDTATSDEIVAALALNPLLANLQRAVPEVVWTYYTSKRGFIYLVPGIPVEDFTYRPKMLQGGYFQDARPDRNPSGKMQLSPVYDDTAGTGLMTTLSVPVLTSRDIFLGVTAVDISLTTLKTAASFGEAIGSTEVVDETGQLVAAPFDFTPGAKTKTPSQLLADSPVQMNGWQELHWSHGVLDGELWVVHKARTFDVAVDALLRVLPTWIVLAFAGALILLMRRLRIANERTEELASIDPLTGALNRRAFDQQAAEWLAQCDRTSSPACIIMIDADHFKAVNDNHGHGIGDEVLTGIADCVRTAKREADQFARFGGEEFVLLAPFTTPEGARILGDRLRVHIAETPMSKSALHITVSVGVAQYRHGEALDETIERADAALYRSKDGGRDQVTVADDPVLDGAGVANVPVETAGAA